MTIQTLSFRLVRVSARERLHACLRFKLVHVAENVKQRPLGSYFLVGRRTPSAELQGKFRAVSYVLPLSSGGAKCGRV